MSEPKTLLLIGDARFKKIIQKLEYHTPPHGWKTLSIEYLANLEKDGKQAQVTELHNSVDLALVVTNETGYLGDAAEEGLLIAIIAGIPIVSLGPLEDYPKIPTITLTEVIENGLSVESGVRVEAEKESPDLTTEIIAEAEQFFESKGKEEKTIPAEKTAPTKKAASKARSEEAKPSDPTEEE